MADNEKYSDSSLLRLVPVVVRARGFRLYTRDGRRLIDLWQNGGAAVLGHTPPNMLRELKNTASRGLFAPLPHFLEGRFIKALSRLFPGRNFRLYSSAPAALEPLLKTGAAGFWRPYLNSQSPFAIANNAPAVLIPILPGIQGWRGDLPQGLCVIAAESETRLAEFPAGDILPPVLLATATRGIYDLIASPDRGKPVFPRLEKVLKKSAWQRTGIYLNLKDEPDAQTWDALFCTFLEAGFLIPPVPSQPLILPDALSDGEEAKLAAVFSTAQD
jgi:hypothetical protein